jgi:hypothetical protein
VVAEVNQEDREPVSMEHARGQEDGVVAFAGGHAVDHDHGRSVGLRGRDVPAADLDARVTARDRHRFRLGHEVRRGVEVLVEGHGTTVVAVQLEMGRVVLGPCRRAVSGDLGELVVDDGAGRPVAHGEDRDGDRGD